MSKIVFVFLIISSFIVSAQPPTKFFSTYGGHGYDVGYDVKQTLDGGYIIAGSTSSFGQGNTDFYLLKLDSMGQKRFEKSFGGYNNEIARSIVQLSDSGYVMTGYTSSFGIGGYDIFLIKTDKNGNLLWQKTIGGNDWDFAYSVDTILGGGFIITGTTYSFGNGNADGYVIKTDVNGDTLWTKTYGGVKDDELKSVIQTLDGNYALTGYTKSYNDSLGDIWVLKINQTGDTLWRKFYGGNKEDFGNQIIENNTNDLFIAGSTASWGAGLLDAYALKINNVGNVSHTFIDGTASNNEVYNSLAFSNRLPNNRVCFTQKEVFTGYGLQTKIIELNNSLTYLNATDYGSPVTDEIYKLVATKDKGYAAVGYTEGYNAMLSNVYFLKMDSTLIGSNYSIVSVNEIYSAHFNVFPNPCSKAIIINSSIKLDNSDIHLIDIYGNELLTNKITHNFKTVIINCEDLKNGIYYLKILNKTEKIIISN